MALYLDEIYFDVPGKDGFKNMHDLIGGALKDGLPPSRKRAGWEAAAHAGGRLGPLRQDHEGSQIAPARDAIRKNAAETPAAALSAAD